MAGEAADSVKHGAHNVAAGARHAASATGHAAHDAKEWTKEKAGVSCWGGGRILWAELHAGAARAEGSQQRRLIVVGKCQAAWSATPDPCPPCLRCINPTPAGCRGRCAPR